MGNLYGLKCLLTTVLLVFLLMGLGGDSAGSTPSMDIRLGYSQASFWGEDAGDFAGTSVAGVGDVNGDGFDDVLIGSPSNDEGGDRAGQVYLILGRANGLARDTNLSKADASFLGESSGDRAGTSVARAGDVNGDGYDDFLINAASNDEGGTDAGQIYLIFGRAFGWAMDTNLSSADASFWGEVPGDRAGYSISSAGDVNNDGYDDILIGADQNDEGGDRAGQAYLILGKATGWTKDTNLSKADASFWGEAPGDWCGVSVAGAGDVNGDGFDDILVGAILNKDGGTDAGQVYLVLGKTTGWSMDVNISKANGSFLGEGDDRCGMVAGAGDVNGDGFDDILISEPMNDDRGSSVGRTYLVLGKAMGWAMDTDLSTANASFWGESAIDQSGASISGVGDINGDGYDDFLIGAPGNDEGDDNAGQAYLFLGMPSGWALDTDLSKANASFLGEAIYDFGGYSVSGAGDVDGDGLGDILIGANNNEDGGTSAGHAYLILSDAYPPRLEMDSTPTNSTTGDVFIFNISASDDCGILDISIEYWYGDGQTHINKTSNRHYGDQFNGTWFLRITTPQDTTETLHYVVHIKDIWRVFKTVDKDVVIRDNDPPSIIDLTQSPATTGDEFSLKMHATDNINLTDVRVEFWLGDEGVSTNVSMTDASFDVWTYIIYIPEDSLETLHYFFYARDNVTNIATTVTRNLTIVDNDMPIIGPDTSKDSATTGDPFNFAIEARDNLDIDVVIVTYRYGGDPSTDLGLTWGDGDLWEATITIDHTLKDLAYLMTARDTSGNENSTEWRTITIADNDPPEVVEDLSDATATTGDVFHARIRVHDNIGVASVNSTDFWTPVDVDEDGNGLYAFEIPIEPDYIGRFYLGITVTDTSGNEGYFELTSREVVDNDPPTILHDSEVTSSLKGLPISLEIEATDNIGVEEMYIEYWFGAGSVKKVTLDIDARSSTIEIPRHPDGNLHYYFKAIDEAGNSVTTPEMSIRLRNEAPQIDDLPTWEVQEGTDSEYDLVPYVTDPNDEVLTVSCDDGNVTIENMVLKLRHDEAIPDRTVTLIFMDGEDQTVTDLIIHVVNVNDPPVIFNIHPPGGREYEPGDTVEFSIITVDEDGDELTVTWWDGDVELGTGSPLEVKLKPGEHTITVVVTDGTDRVDDTFTVVVKKEEESPSASAGFVLMALLVVAIASVSRLRKGTWKTSND